MNLSKPPQDTITDIIIDHAFRYVAGYYVLKTLLETKNWSFAFGQGGFGDGVIRWQGDKNGIHYSVAPDRIVMQITVHEIMNRANKWICKFVPGEQLELF